MEAKNKTPLQQLTTLIQASNPELMTLGVGCEIELYGDKIICRDIFEDEIVYQDDSGMQTCDISYIEDKESDSKIIGKPPTLVDVLKWVKSLYTNIPEYHQQRFKILELWDLNSIYLRDQSSELINFLLELKK